MALMDRAKQILLAPKEAWPVIEAEQTTIGALYTGYIIPLAAIGAAASLLGSSIFSVRGFRMPFAWAFRHALSQFVGALVVVFVLSIVIDRLAPTFDARRNAIQALKLATYSWTAYAVGGFFALIPPLAIPLLAILGLYSLYLLYLGLPVLMQAPTDKTVGYLVVVTIVAVILFYLVSLVIGGLA